MVLRGLFLQAGAQSIGNYTAVRTTGVAYSSIFPGGIACSSWRNNTGFLEQDDNRSDPQDIGFDFWYDGTRYTQFSVSTNGFIDFSASAATGMGTGAYGYVNTEFSANGGTLLSIAPMYDDMTTLGVTDPLGNSIRYDLTGTAPNRVLTVEWLGMSIYQHPTVNLNYQLRLYETTGRIEFYYGSMSPTTLTAPTYSYTCGLNGPTISNTPTAAQLKCQVASNNAAFNQQRHDTLKVTPTANSKILFSPPQPANPVGALTFTGVTQTTMTLNWTDWATNEVGYAIYYSTDGVSYFFKQQNPAGTGAMTAPMTGLNAGTTYYWKVYAVTEGWLSNPLSGTQATVSVGSFVSAQTGNWGTGSTWVGGVVPTNNADVTIANGHTVTINTNITVNHLTVGQGTSGTLLIGSNNAARTITLNGTVTVKTGASFSVNAASNTTHALTTIGNIVNNGTFDMQPDANSMCTVTCTKSFGNQAVSGTGATTRFNTIVVNMGALQTNTLEITTPSFSTFSATTPFLTLTVGTFKLSAPGTAVAFNGTTTIDEFTHLWINNAGATIKTTAGDLDFGGKITVSAGKLMIGDAANNSLLSRGGLLTITGGSIDIAGRYNRANTNSTSRFTISGGVLTVPTVGSTSTTDAPFMMQVPGSSFTQTGGTIVIQREGGSGAQNLGFTCTGGSINTVTGGVLQIGNALTPVAQIMNINTPAPVGALLVFNVNAPTAFLSSALTVKTDVSITGGTLNANNQNMTVGRNWNNTGGTYTPGANTTTFNGSSPQSISKTAAPETFNHVTCTNPGTKYLASNITCQNMIINAGTVLDCNPATGFTINLKGNWSNSGNYHARTNGLVNCNGTTAQTIGGAAQTVFRHLTVNNAAGVALNADAVLVGTLTLTSGMFTTTGHNFTLYSDANGTARIAAITGGNITGNITMQRYLGPGPTGWRMLGSCVTGSTLTDWLNDFTMSGFPGSDYPNMAFCSEYTYDETKPGIKDTGWVKPTTISLSTAGTKGVLCYVGPVPLTMGVTGPPKKFAQSFAITYTPSGGALNDGWNLISNPYPSAIDWDATGWTRTRVNGAVYTWNSALQQYTAYVGGIGVNGGSRYIASTQAFWVQANGASPAMSINEAQKGATDPTFMRMPSNALTGALRLNLAGNNYTDETIIRFSPTATMAYDSTEDAYKFYSTNVQAPGIASLADTADMSINSLPPLTSNLSIPVRVIVGATGTYTISRDTVMGMPKSSCIVLEDLLTGAMTDLTTTMSYSFSIADTTHAPRFLLHIGAPLTKSSLASNCATSSDGAAIAEGIGNGPWDYTWKDAAGTTLAVHTNVSGPDSLLNIPAGVYTVQVNGNAGLCGLLEDTVQVNGPMPFYAVTTTTNPYCPGDMGGAINVLTMLGGTAPYTYEWSTTDNTQSIANLAAGNYWLRVTDAHGCFDTLHYTLAQQSQLTASFTMSDDTVYVGQNNTVIFSNYTSGGNAYTWDFGDGAPLDYNSNPAHTYTVAGTYTATLVASDSLCSDTMMQTIVVYDFSGINDPALAGQVQIQQTPDGNFVNFNLPAEKEALIDVFDAAGKAVIERMRVSAYVNRVRLPLHHPAEGIYFVKVTVDGKMVVRKVKI